MSNLISLLFVVIKRLWHNLGLSVSALAGMVCVLAITICIPIFSNGVSREMLRRELAEQALDTHRALFSLHLYYNDTEPPYVLDVDTSRRLAEYITARVEDLAGVNVQQMVMQIESPGLPMRAVQDGLYDDANLPLKNLRFVSVEDLLEHVQVIEGEWPSPETSDAGPISIAIHETVADGMGLNVGEQYALGQATMIEIAAVWRAIDPHEEFWFNNPKYVYGEAAWVPLETYQTRVEPELDHPVFSTSWYVVVDNDSLRFERAPMYARTIQRLDNEMRSQLTDSRLDYSPFELLVTFQERAESLTTLLYAVGAPILVLALLFIGLTSSIAVQQRALEGATMRSRGTSRLQIVTLNLGESAVLLAVALPVSFAAGRYAATVMSQTRSFLEFTPRPALGLTYDGLSVALLIAASAFIVIARLLPALRDSRRSAVRRKQQRSRESSKPLWQRLYLDILLLLISLYAYAVLRGWAVQTELVPQLELSGQPYRDPLLFVAPALFAIAASVALMRVVPLIARMLAGVGARLPGAWQYLSLQQIARRPQDHTSALMLIMISLSLAIFAASAARTLDQWLLDSVYYDTGADLAIREMLPPMLSESSGGMSPSATSSVGESTADAASASVTLADLGMMSDWYFSQEQHKEIPGVENATRVGRYKGTAFVGGEQIPGWILGVDRMELPQVAFFRNDFATVSLGELMNRLGAKPEGVLIPGYVADEKGLSVGDYLLISIVGGEETYERDFEVIGVYDYFPTVYPDERATFIVNLEYIFGNPDAVDGFDIWLSLAVGTEIPPLVDEIGKETRMRVSVKGNASSVIRQGQELVERVGLFGVLNVGFLTAGLMAAIGFVLYSYASLRRRFIELGILQAIGLPVRQLVGYLVTEQLMLMGLAILGGVIVGLMTSYLYVPFLQTSASPGTPVPPFQVFIGWTEAAWLALGFGLVLCLTMLGTIAYLVRLRTFQAVKLGETL